MRMGLGLSILLQRLRSLLPVWTLLYMQHICISDRTVVAIGFISNTSLGPCDAYRMHQLTKQSYFRKWIVCVYITFQCTDYRNIFYPFWDNKHQFTLFKCVWIYIYICTNISEYPLRLISWAILRVSNTVCIWDWRTVKLFLYYMCTCY